MEKMSDYQIWQLHTGIGTGVKMIRGPSRASGTRNDKATVLEMRNGYSPVNNVRC